MQGLLAVQAATPARYLAQAYSLEAAGAGDAELIVIAVEGAERITAIADMIKRHYPHVKIAARAIDRADPDPLCKPTPDEPLRCVPHDIRVEQPRLRRIAARITPDTDEVGFVERVGGILL